MSFIDEYMNEAVPGYPCVSVPLTKTTIAVNAAGREKRNQEWEHPRHRFILPEALGRQWSVVEGLMTHWRIMAGPFNSFPWRDPLDFASTGLTRPNIEPVISGTDQPLGTGDGITEQFQLIKRYTLGAQTYDRDIVLPVLSSVVIAADGVAVDPADYSVSRQGGIVTFDTAPADSVVLTAGFYFDVEVRFESDDQLEAILRTIEVGGFADLTLLEVRPC